MKRSNYYFIGFMFLMFGSIGVFFIDEVPTNGKFLVFISFYIGMIPVVMMMVKEENKEGKIKHDNECQCDCGRCCKKLKLEKKSWWNRKK